MTQTDKSTGGELDKAADVMPEAATGRDVVIDSEVFQRFLASAEVVNDEVDPEAVTMEIVARVLNAETVDDVLGDETAIHARDYLNTPFTLLDVKFNRSKLDTSATNFYAVMTGADANGERVVITCGAKRVIAQAWKLADMDALPVAVQIEQSPNPTSEGFHVMWLAKAPASF